VASRGGSCGDGPKQELGRKAGALLGQNFLHKTFARVSPVFLAAGLVFLSPSLSRAESGAKPEMAVPHSEDADTRGNTVRRQAASTQYARAEELRAQLNSKPADKRALSEYKQVVASYRRVYLITPHASEVPDALLAVAELYTEMGNRFGRSYFQLATDSYQFLLHEYPTSHFGQDAMLRMAGLQKDQLGDSTAATKTFEEFLKKYPRSVRKREAQEALAEMALLRNSEELSASAPTAAPAAKDAEKTAEAAELARRVPEDAVLVYANPGHVPRLRRIGASAAADSTRVIIDLEDLVQYSSARIRNPDRIFFDLHAARLTPELARQEIHVEGDLLSAVRVAQNQAGVVRVVLSVNGVKDYAASLLSNPPQLVIDLYPDSRGAAVRAAKTKRNARQGAAEEPNVDSAAAREERSAVQPVSTATARVEPFGPPVSLAGAAPNGGTGSGAEGAAISAPHNSSLVDNSTATGRSGKSRKNAKSMGAKPDLIQPASAALPTRDGQSTLTRTLGLKIGRIVIDAGHGGHDTGTIGPTGLMEKDLCLDVAQRLGKIIHQRLPGADVVYTRSDDTFIPLEERTRIANESRADLFISIHANSSHDHAARGIETYYLNLKGSPDAMEVAARENATATESIHDLEDIVKKIARSEKIDESREFAADIQESLAKRIQKLNKTVKDRGVRKAPFVVLVGADMPSILTEISFLSNPADEQLLKKPEHRQRVAEGLYQGVASYLQSLNSVTLNSPSKSLGTTPVSASVEQSRNQR
jgi:N-acetylmuramoyl-L-alanine amidase